MPSSAHKLTAADAPPFSTPTPPPSAPLKPLSAAATMFRRVSIQWVAVVRQWEVRWPGDLRGLALVHAQIHLLAFRRPVWTSTEE